MRFDGGHRKDALILSSLGPYVEWVPVCPEVEMGLSIPREALRLERHPSGIRLVHSYTKKDRTSEMRDLARRRTRALAEMDLCGYILKKGSPTCGMERVKIYSKRGMPDSSGVGLFASALLDAQPELPVEEEGRLRDPKLRDNFVERIFAYRRLKDLFRNRWKISDLVDFHTRHKLQVLAHSPGKYRELGRLVARAKEIARPTLEIRYGILFMQSLRTHATPARHVNVMQHCLGYFSESLDSGSRDEILALFEDHRKGLVPLIVPLTMLKHHVRRFSVDYLASQTYLEPHPKELMLRNHV